ncbi:MAG: Crp/Fnr family transcriptional regulator [Phototrophicaceae bacterium]
MGIAKRSSHQPTMPLPDLSALFYFKGLPPAALERVMATAHSHRYQAGAMIFNEGTKCAGFHILQEGMVRVYRLGQEGRLHTLNLLRPPSTFNEVSALDGAPNPFNATAVTEVTVWVIRRDPLLQLMGEHPVLLKNYVQALAQMNREYLERLEDMTFRTIPARLAKLFLHESPYALTEAPTRLSQEEIAAILGTTREVVGRALRGMMNDGLLRKEGRAIYIQDRLGLEHLAHHASFETEP